MIMGAFLIVSGIAGIFFCGGMYVHNRIQKNMMADLVEYEDMARWLRIWT